MHRNFLFLAQMNRPSS